MKTERGPDRTNLVSVSIGELAVSTDRRATLVTHALGSCVAVALWSPALPVAGLIHIMLPASPSPEHGRLRPAMYADTGIALLLQRVRAVGARPEDLVVRIAGGASLLPEVSGFAIGARNVAVVRRVLADAGLTLRGMDVGGAVSRTLWLRVADGNLSTTAYGNAAAG